MNCLIAAALIALFIAAMIVSSRGPWPDRSDPDEAEADYLTWGHKP